MRILITGVTGFVGGHLAEALLAVGTHELFGFTRTGWSSAWQHLADRIPIHIVDWTNKDELIRLLAQIQPDRIFHLAGYAHNGRSFQESDASWAGNLQLTKTFYDAIARWGGFARILFSSTGLVYGDPTGPDQVCDEQTPLNPPSPYAASKAAADLMSYQYTRHPGLHIVRARAFNHIGPKQSADYAAPNFARQLAAIELGKLAPVVETGDLSGRRDLSDVRDVVQAYIQLIEKGQNGEVYNIGSGQTCSMQEILDQLVRITRVRVEVRQKIDPSRKGDSTAVARADCRKLQSTTGWQPKYTLEQTLQEMLIDWRDRQK